jgi:CIC family chloride channel protein
MIFEMTDNYSIILPLMIANITSYVVAYELCPTPIYDALLQQDGIRLPHEQKEVLKQISAPGGQPRRHHKTFGCYYNA